MMKNQLLVGVLTTLFGAAIGFGMSQTFQGNDVRAHTEQIITLKQCVQELGADLKNGRTERLKFQGEIRADLARLEQKVDSLKEAAGRKGIYGMSK